MELETFYPPTRQDWRQWLEENHQSKKSVWLVYYKLKSGMPSISWSEAVEEALCFGWIDSKAKPLDEEKYLQFFSKRKARSTWSKVNKEKIKRLLEAELMAPAGLESIETAKQNGSWTILDEVEELIIPGDLEQEFDGHPGSKDFFISLSKSVKKAMLQWLVLARRPETRQKRMREIAAQAGQQRRPKPF